MRRKRIHRQFTPVELEIMKALWAAGSATVQGVRERLEARPKPAYTTVQTMLNVLHRKGCVKRVLTGKAYEYVPRVSREGAFSLALRDMIDRLFAGSTEDLVMTLVRDHHLTPEQFARLRSLVEEAPASSREHGAFRSRKGKPDATD